MDIPVDIHWKQKPPKDPDAATIYGPPMCNSYSMGNVLGEGGPGIAALPIAGVSFAPNVGTFSLHTENGPPDHPWGASQGAAQSIENLTAAEYNLHAINPVLSRANLSFSNGQLYALPDDWGNAPSGARWNVPMASGAEHGWPPKFLFAESYTLDVSWQSSRSGLFGEAIFGLSVGRPGPSGSPPAPAYPDYIFGASGAYSCDIPMPKPTEAHPYGTAYLFWMFSYDEDIWYFGGGDFMGACLVRVGDQYIWTITANCVAEEPGS
jgi:hypothetical protein